MTSSASASASSLAAMEEERDNSGSKGGRRVPATLPPPPEEVLRCPRCDSPNTKFCYYNNYSLTQPRHFCKACRRYWTKGGALRNVPVGGGSRKNKKPKSSSSSSSSSSLLDGKLNALSFPPEAGLGFKYFPGISPEFQFGTIPVSRLHFARANIPSTCGDLIGGTAVSSEVSAGATTSDVPMVGINYPIGILPENTTNNYTNSHARFASTIESLSSINQDLHWKLQQQRLGMLYGGETTTSAGLAYGGTQVGNQSQPISFQMDGSEALGFGSGDACVGDGIGSGSGSGSGSEWYPHNSSDTSRNMGNYTDVIKRWKDMHEFSALP